MKTKAGASESDRPGLLARLSERLQHLHIPDRPEFDRAARRLVELAAALAHRSRDGHRPAIGLVLGPSGAGKSTLFNALIGRAASQVSSVERPMTRGALLAIPDAAVALPSFPTIENRSAREFPSRGVEGGIVALRTGGSPLQSPLIDGPDYDTHVQGNRDLAERLLWWADRVVLVSSPERYADRAALPMVRELATLGTPVLLVLNKTDATGGELMADWRGRLDVAGLRPAGEVLIPRRGRALDGEESTLDAIRAFLSRTGRPAPIGPALARLEREIQEVLLPELDIIRDGRRRLEAGLRSFAVDERAFEPGPSLEAIGRFEEETRFWLRYSPRGLVRGALRFARRPASFFAVPKAPGDPDPEEIESLVRRQARDCHENQLIELRERLQRDAFGRRLLTAGGPRAFELPEEEIDRRIDPVARELSGFALELGRRLRRDAGGFSASPLRRIRFLLVDKLVKLIAFGATLAVFPPLLHEILRALGLPALRSEVETKVAGVRRHFREALAGVAEAQAERLGHWIGAFGPASADVDALREILVQLGLSGSERRA